MHGNAAMGRKCVYGNVKESKEAGATGHAQVGQAWGGARLCSEEKGKGRKERSGVWGQNFVFATLLQGQSGRWPLPWGSCGPSERCGEGGG